MMEDDSYRKSSQYRLWSFTTTQLQHQRAETNRIASAKVRDAFARARSQLTSTANDTDTQSASSTPAEIDTLTPDEEQKIVQWYCSKVHEMKELEPRPPSAVIATAIQYLRRFYLYNSPMTYNPKSIMVSCLWLAYKAEHFPGVNSMQLFVKQLDITDDEVKAPEFLIMQALRFTIEVRHPMRGLEGGIAEIRLQASKLKCFQTASEAERRKRIDVAGDKAKALLTHETQMTDAYFLYTPAQMWLAALLIVDEEQTTSYINHLFDRLGTAVPPIKQKLIDTITGCAELIRSYKLSETDGATKKELNRIGKKLRKCQNPEKVDIVAVAREKMAEKREMSESDMEKKAKKRKLEQERLEADGDVFGPDLNRVRQG